MKCKKCGNKIKPNEKFCSECGFEIKDKSNANKEKAKKEINIKRTPVWLTALIVSVCSVFMVLALVIGFVAIISEDEMEKDVETTDNYDDYITNENDSNTETIDEDKMIYKVTELFDDKLAFDTGSYIKGEIPAGDYAFVKFAGSGSYYCENDDSGNIIDNENFDSFGYVHVHAAGNLETRGVLVNVNAFEKLGVKSAKEIYEQLNDKTDWNQAGYYKVGVDIEPGTYVAESLGSGYYAIMSGPVGNSDIIDNNIFNGKASFTIQNGQYLQLSRATITKQ